MSTRPDWLGDIRVVGFDLDQTLYPKSPEIDKKIQAYLYETIAAARGVSRNEAERLFTERYRGGSGLTGSQTLRDLSISGASEVIQEALERADIVSLLAPDAETNRFLAHVRTSYEGTDLITGSSLDQTNKKLRALGLFPGLFSHIITADDATKSDGGAYRAWLARYPTFAPHQFLYVGDRVKSDHEVPSALGIKTSLVYVEKVDTKLSALQVPTLRELLGVL